MTAIGFGKFVVYVASYRKKYIYITTVYLRIIVYKVLKFFSHFNQCYIFIIPFTKSHMAESITLLFYFLF